MARRKNKRMKRQGSREHEEKPIHQTSLEEDLRQQRMRQQQRMLKKEKQKETTPSPDNCDQQVDFVPPPSTFGPQHILLTGNRLPWPDPLPERPSMHMYSVRNQSAIQNSTKRRRLQYWTLSKYSMENLQIYKRASSLYVKRLKWMNHVLPDGMHCAWDMACKYHLHPSARTLDVACWNNDGDSPLPFVATAVQGGWGLFRPPSNARIDPVHTFRCKPVYSIRMHEKSHRLGVICRGSRNRNANTFQWYDLPHASTSMEAELPAPVNDFCFGSDLVLFACNRFDGSGQNSSVLAPLFMPLGTHSELRTLNVNNFPQSDALRVEMACHHEKYLAFGHRNGQVSLLDLRQTQSCLAILASNDCAADWGSASDLGFLRSETHVLVKRAFGACQLHDLRRLSNQPSSLVHTFRVGTSSLEERDPSLHKTLSSNCNGFCVDPSTEQTLVAPFVNDLHQPCLGVWNLTTGDWIGARALQENPHKEAYFVELCSRPTPACLSSGDNSPSDSSSFGVWFKCGRFSAQKMNSKIGSLNHMTLPGRWQK